MLACWVAIISAMVALILLRLKLPQAMIGLGEKQTADGTGHQGGRWIGIQQAEPWPVSGSKLLQHPILKEKGGSSVKIMGK